MSWRCWGSGLSGGWLLCPSPRPWASVLLCPCPCVCVPGSVFRLCCLSRLSVSPHVSLFAPLSSASSLCLSLLLPDSSLPSWSLSVSPLAQGRGGSSLRLAMTPLPPIPFPPHQYPDGVFYDLDSCKHPSYPDSEGAPGE